MERLSKWYFSKRVSVRLLLQSVTVAVPFYFSPLLSYQITEIGKMTGLWGIAVHAIVFTILFVIIVLLHRYVMDYVVQLSEHSRLKVSFVQHAYTHVDRLITRGFAKISGADALGDMFKSAFCAHLDTIQEVVQATYDTFEATYGKEADIDSRVDFEVTFMTLSYRDGKITIPASANREGRAPRSMILRKQVADIYDGTVTDLIYKEARPQIHIIERTEDPGANYKELYPGEKERLKSSIVFPVLSDKNELLATLVVHCDRTGFFQESDKKYWATVLEVFGKRVGLAKRKLDLVVKARVGGVEKVDGKLVDAPF